MNVLPTQTDFKYALPLLWSPALQSLLPEAAEKLFTKQKIKHDADLAAASMVAGFLHQLAAMTSSVRMTATELGLLYTHSWLLVNSRCFYWDYPSGPGVAQKGKMKATKGPKRKPESDRNDCMAMCPVIDCFNHSGGEDVRSCTSTVDRNVHADGRLVRGHVQ